MRCFEIYRVLTAAQANQLAGQVRAVEIRLIVDDVLPATPRACGTA